MRIDALSTLKDWRSHAVGEGLIHEAEFNDEHLLTLLRGLFNQGQLEPAKRRLGLAERGDAVVASAWRYLAGRSGDGYTVALVPADLLPLNGMSVDEVQEGAAATTASERDSTAKSDQVANHPWARYSGPPPQRRNNLTVRADGDAVVVSWRPEGQDTCRLFRVVFREDYSPFSPEAGVTATATTSAEAAIPAPLHHGIRYVTVWQYSGRDEEAARNAQPLCVADGEIVAAPRGVRITQDGDRAICRWELPQKAIQQHTLSSVEVVRYDAADIEAGAVDGFGGYPIQPNTPNLGGFVDDSIEPGAKYVYRVSVRARNADGAEILGQPLDFAFAPESPLEPVIDLHVYPSEMGADGLLDLTWTPPPAGQVVIYRTDRIPDAGHDRDSIAIETLPRIGLPDALQLPNPVDFAPDGRRIMRGVGRPSGWHMVFFTPVTITDRDARVGHTVNGEPAPDAPTHFTIVERVSDQILRFGWPTGATEVEIRLGPLGATEEAVLERAPWQRLTADEYASSGGFSCMLPWNGAHVVITSSRSWSGTSFPGGSASAVYRGILPIKYSISRTRGLVGAPTVRVSLWTDSGRDSGGNPRVQNPPSFVLVHHPSRLPLSADEQDGTVIPVRLADTAGETVARFRPTTLYNGPGVEQWEGVLKDRALRRGYYRLFVSEERATASRYALLDPPLRTMRA